MRTAHILLIEDDTDMAFLIKETLEFFDEIDFVLTSVSCYSETKMLDLATFDAILTDLDLPDIGSEILIYRLRERAEDIPLLIITGYSQPSLIVEVMKLGVKDFLVKSEIVIPLIPHRIKQILQDVRLQKSVERQLREKEDTELRISTLKQTLATLAHYINNSTTAISGFAQLCQLKIDDIHRLKRFPSLAISETSKISIVLEELEKIIENKEVNTTSYASLENAMFDLDTNIKRRLNVAE